MTSLRVHSRHNIHVGLQAWVSDCEPLVGPMVPTLHCDVKITSISDADSLRGTEWGVSRPWPPAPGLALGTRREALGKNLQNEWKQASAVSG